MVNRKLNLSNIFGNNNKSILLFGPRGVGKTSLVENYIATLDNCFSINLLIHEEYLKYLTNISLFRAEIKERLTTNPKHLTVFIDEIQKLPYLLDEVHMFIEKNKTQVRFILTGSSARKLKRGSANLLGGRAWTFYLHPLSISEHPLHMEKTLKIGSLPSIYLEDSNPERTLKSYVETFLKEEILQESIIRKTESFIRFLEVAAQLNGEPVNYSSIARDCHVSTQTVQAYFSILVDTLISFRLDGWSKSIRKQLLQSPKYYFFDCGVLNTIRGEIKLELKPGSSYYGKLFETWIIQELIRLNDYTETDYKFNYWRTNTGLEVDVVLTRGQEMIGVEIKSTNVVRKEDLHGLKSFHDENPKAVIFCIANVSHSYKIDSVIVCSLQEFINKIFLN